ncbi:MAG: family 78 glycoside hydrolase catalytic domain [Chloroflexi bacterium]|nr:family 78 glycoside hydrolase catalytic domain [Chloroflexota bacterium]
MKSPREPLAPYDLRCEYLVWPLGLDEPQPRLSWLIADSRRGARQSAYQVVVASSLERLARGRGDLWSSGKVLSNQSAQVPYAGKPLRSRQRTYWKVRAWDANDRASPWSAPQGWEMGLLGSDDWTAEWIGLRADTLPPPCAYLRKPFRLAQAPTHARIYVTALGLYELHLNGRRVGDQLLTPGWTDYRRRVLVQTYDVTEHLRMGENALGAVLGEGWYCGALTWQMTRGHFGEPPPRLLLQCEIEFANGTTQRIVSDGSWRGRTGPIRSSGLYEGEFYDARLEIAGWDQPGFDASGWNPVERFADPGIERNAQREPPIRITEELAPVAVTQPQPGVAVYDFGQNVAGFCRLRVTGSTGATIRLRHAEVLAPDGSLYTDNLRNAQATDTYILNGDPAGETFTPHFTYHGFRFVEMTGYAGTAPADALTALVFHNDARQTATLTTSSELVTQLQSNIIRGQRGNLHSVPTDCPQRDERMGWLGDALVFARAACTNMDMAAFLSKFARDMADTQTPEGALADVAPYLAALPRAGAPAWMDAIVIVPWTLYQCYGDVRILQRHFNAMARYVDYLNANNPDGLWVNRRGNDYGDWVPADSQTDKTMLATLFFYQSARIVAEVAGVCGRDSDVKRYERIAAKVRRAFNQHYLRGGRYRGATQTINAIALVTGITPKAVRASVARDLVRDVRRRGGHLSTGFAGTRYLLPALCDAGYDDVAYRVLLQRDYPSWGYMIAKGATTIWERWDGDRAGPEMNSFNHFALGSVGEWLFRYLGGIDVAADGAGYEHIVVRPRIVVSNRELTWVSAAYDSMHGRIASEWRVAPDQISLHVVIPANTRATVHLPAASAGRIRESGLPLARAVGIAWVRRSRGGVVCEIGAGDYSFAIRRDA